MNNLSEFLKGWLLAEEAAFDSILLKRKYIDICGGNMHDGVMLSQIMFWHGKNKETGKLRLQIFRDGHYWLAKSYQDWWKECRVNEHTARKCIDRLEELGVIETRLWKFAGSPTKHIRMVWERFEELIRALPEDDDGEKSVLTSKVNSPLRSNPIDTTGHIQMTLEDKSICDVVSDPIHRLPTETTSQTTSEIIIVCDENTEPEQVQVEPVRDKKRKDMASQNEKPKSNRKNKNEVTDLDREELQPLLDLYNQEKPARWDTAKSLTPSRVRNLRRLIKDHKENTVSVIRRGLLGAKRRNTAQYNWSIDTFIKEDNDWCTVYAESVSEDELLDKGGATPSIDINSLSKEQKAEYERKSNLMAFYAKQQQKNGGTAA